MWSGAQTGSWNYIHYQIPTYAGSTLSGMAYTSGDVGAMRDREDNPKVYARDLQWKSMLPVMMSINSLFSSRHDDLAQQPWAFGQP